MGLLAYLRRLWTRLFGPRVEKADRRRRTRQSDDDPTVTVDIYQTANLTEARGRTPERMVARQLSHALDAAGVSHRIDSGHEATPQPPDREDFVSPETLDWWRDSAPETDADTSLLLLDARGGGYGYVDGEFCMSGARRVTRMEPAVSETDHPRGSARYNQIRNLRAAMHEVGHTYGGVHDTPMLRKMPKVAYTDAMIELFRESE